MKTINLTAGDSYSFKFDNYVLNNGYKTNNINYNLTLLIRGPTALNIDGIATDNGWVCELNIQDSLKLQASNYRCAVLINWDNDTKRETVEEFNLLIKPNLSNVQNFDNTTLAQKAFAECQKALAKFNNEGILVKKLQIHSRIIEFNTITELLDLVKYWEQQVYLENQKQQKITKKSNKMLQIGFTRG